MSKENKERLQVIQMDSSSLDGCIARGSCVYVDPQKVSGLPRNTVFMAQIGAGEDSRYFTAQAQQRGKRTMLRLGQEHDSPQYRSC